jgi:hypothetical protein
MADSVAKVGELSKGASKIPRSVLAPLGAVEL